jgi:hypothetical protein
MTMTHVRHQQLLALITPMLVAGPIAAAIEQKRVLDLRRATRVATSAIVIVAAIFGLNSLAWPVERGEGVQWPVSALKAAPPEIRSRRVYNEVNSGLYLIFAGVRPFVDDRVELYGDRPTQFDFSFLDANSVDRTIAEPQTSFDARLDSDPEWVRIRDQFAVVHVRKSVWDAVKGGGS